MCNGGYFKIKKEVKLFSKNLGYWTRNHMRGLGHAYHRILGPELLKDNSHSYKTLLLNNGSGNNILDK